MANIECKDCGDLVDVEARTVTLPFVCKWCEEDFILRNHFTSSSMKVATVGFDPTILTPMGCSTISR